MKHHLKTNVSKFYYNIDNKELEDNYDSDELHDVNEDELQFNHTNILEEDNKQVSKDYAANIQERMHSMSDTYRKVTQTMEENLKNVQTYIKQLQNMEYDTQV